MDFKPIFHTEPIPELRTLVKNSTRLYGKQNAFLVKTSDESYRGITYSEFDNDIDALGTALVSLGLKDQHIAVIGENRYEWCVTYLAVVNGTGVIVPLDRELPPHEIQNLLIRSNASAIIFSGKLGEEIKKISSALPSVKFFIDMDSTALNEDGSDCNGFMSYSFLVAKGKSLLDSGDRTFLDAPIDNTCMNMLIFTSGTTDLAKGVMLSHMNICSNIRSVSSVINFDSSDSILSILPLHHTYQCTAGFLVMLYRGCTISFTEGLKYIGKNLKETKPSLLLAVPLILESMYRKIWDQAAKKKGMKTKLKVAISISNVLYNIFKIDLRKKIFKAVHENIGGNIRLVISGAAAIEPSVSKGLRAMGIHVLQGYGLTECSPIVTVNREYCFRDDSIGQPIPGLDVRLVDTDQDGIGEIAVKGDSVMLGYFKNSQATEKVLKDGWLYTGDLAYIDKQGFLYITGRKKNVIVTKNGKNIFPEEVESYINKSPYILESLVTGKYDEESGEMYVNAQIYPDFELLKTKLAVQQVTVEDARRIINNEIKSINRTMPLYKRIKDFTIRENEFEKTTTRKIKRYGQ